MRGAPGARVTGAGIVRAAVVFGGCLAFPFVFRQHWLINMAFFALMYAGLAQSWNLIGGFAGYISLGHVAFFGIGAYAEAILFRHIGIGADGLVPFFVLPGVGLAVAWSACRSPGWPSGPVRSRSPSSR